MEVNLRSRDNEHLNNLAEVKNETVTHEDNKKISEILEDNKIKFIDNETELFSIAKKETNDSFCAGRTDIIFAQNGEKVCTYSSHPDVNSDTTDITVLFENKEIKDAKLNKVNDENVQGAANEFKF